MKRRSFAANRRFPLHSLLFHQRRNERESNEFGHEQFSSNVGGETNDADGSSSQRAKRVREMEFQVSCPEPRPSSPHSPFAAFPITNCCNFTAHHRTSWSNRRIGTSTFRRSQVRRSRYHVNAFVMCCSTGYFVYQLQAGVVQAFDVTGEEVWSSTVRSPIAAVWELKNGQLKEKSLFETSSSLSSGESNVAAAEDEPATPPANPRRLAFVGEFNSTPYVIVSARVQKQLISDARRGSVFSFSSLRT